MKIGNFTHEAEHSSIEISKNSCRSDQTRQNKCKDVCEVIQENKTVEATVKKYKTKIMRRQSTRNLGFWERMKLGKISKDKCSILAVELFCIFGFFISTTVATNLMRPQEHHHKNNSKFNISDNFDTIEEGILLSSKTCIKEFNNKRWNCTRTPISYFKALLNRDTKESAFVHALASAAVAYAVTTGCTKGDLVECGCDNSRVRSYDLLRKEAARRNIRVNETILRQAAEQFQWGGCGDNIDYGYQISSHFFGEHRSGDLKSRVIKHNYEAGRLAIKNHMEKSCKCHGLSGTCTIHTCWQQMPQFVETSSRLHYRYNSAVPVKLNNDMGSLLVARALRMRHRKRGIPGRNKRDISNLYSNNTLPANNKKRVKRRKRGEMYSIKSKRRHRKHMPFEEDLVFADPSPSFCRKLKRGGSLGTTGRECDPTIIGAGSCDELCCDRGHDEKRVYKTKPCRCRFKYCCEVVCDECSVETTIFTCR